MDTMNERVTLAIRTSGLSASEVSRRLGVSPEAVLQWMNGPGWVARIAAAVAIVGVGLGMLLLVAMDGLLPAPK